MSPEQKAAYVNSQATCAMIEAMGMQAANKEAELTFHVMDHWADQMRSMGIGGCGSSSTPPTISLPFKKADFDALAVKYGLHHNAVHEYCFIP